MTLPPRRTSGSTAMDDYLEQILHLIKDKGYARAVDISKKLGISQAVVPMRCASTSAPRSAT